MGKSKHNTKRIPQGCGYTANDTEVIMKFLIVAFSLLLMATSAPAAPIEIDNDSSVLTPEQEAEFYDNYLNMEILNTGRAATFKFPQTIWNECADEITGNYYGYACAKSRGIAVILKKFLFDYIYDCVDAGLAATGGGTVSDLHIVHAGILGDVNHAPKSLHSQNRAIDIKSFEMKLTNGQVKKLVYEGTTNRTFYTAFRKCWGEVVHKYNGCPYYANSPGLTATIGWENKDHQRHMHTSVPYCINGQYSSLYYQK